MSIVLDIIILLLMGLGVFTGFRRGLIAEVFRIATIILGIIISRIFYLQVAEALGNIITDPTVAKFASFLLIFVIAAPAFAVAFLFLQKIIKISLVVWLDHLAGAVLGFLKGAIIISIVIAVLAYIPSPAVNEWVDNSVFAPFFFFMIRAITFLLPPEFIEGIREWLPT
ncbi:CvpA family protein [candidate division NPL-UPA2 bacterium]|nr:CvpA family protein [candidate division NPL-UPA2 bacterium]